ncbi:MAG: hypothetical protein CMO64_00480 [Verrucomicrobiales bacterium]|jgi:uncharacterized protein (TIRG00374 family)|nr:hypothetical protein [Acidobacteriota bacterium]MBO34659.1 hypothetical protein [Verrucomicrobiales bacterium]
MKPWLRVLLLVAGLGLFGYFIYDAGPGNILEAYRGLGWWSLGALVPFAVVLSIDALGWRYTFAREYIRDVRYRTLWYVRLAGEAVNNVIPSMYVGGEATKVYLLHKRGVPVAATTAAAVRSKTAQSVAQSTFIAMAALMAAVMLPAGAAMELPGVSLPVKPVFIGVAALGFVFMMLLFLLQSRGMFMTLLGWVRGLGLKLRRMEKHEERLLKMDAAIFNFYSKSRRRFVRCTLVYLLGWMTDTVEIVLVSHVLGKPVEWHDALVIEAFIGVAKGLYVVVPGAFGVQEFAVVALFTMFGYDRELGVQYAIIRRGRELAFTALGWGFLYHDESGLRGITKRVQEEAAEMQAVEDQAREETLED